MKKYLSNSASSIEIFSTQSFKYVNLLLSHSSYFRFCPHTCITEQRRYICYILKSFYKIYQCNNTCLFKIYSGKTQNIATVCKFSF